MEFSEAEGETLRAQPARAAVVAAPLPLRRPLAFALAIASGLLYYLAFPGVGLWPLGFVSLAPLLLSVRSQRPVVAAALGLTAGTTTTFLGFFWLLGLLRQFSGFPTAVCVALLVLLSVAQGGRAALLGVSTTWIDRKGWPHWVALLLAFVLAETAYPLLFPWYFGAVVHEWPRFIQLADIGGPVLLSVQLLVPNMVLADFAWRLLRRVPLPTRRYAVITGLALLLPLVYGSVRVALVDAAVRRAPTAKLGIVQGNVPMDLAPGNAYRQKFEQQLAMTEQLQGQGAELVIWPESAFLYALPADAPAPVLKRLLAGRVQVPLLVGALLEEDRNPHPRVFNSALATDHAGNVVGRYDKRHLLPFGEYLPFGETFPVLYELSPGSGRISPGSSPAPLPFEGRRIAVLICYEDVLPNVVVDAVRHGTPHLLVNLTNDAWFGNTHEPWAHLALAKLRAVEHHRFLVRATTTGVSAVIDPVGRLTAATGTFVEASILERVAWLHGDTVYGWWGNGPWYLVCLLAVGACVFGPSSLRSLRSGMLRS
ncbi:MAG: apolipoprotein N-acyltransferase [Polyangiaceae bacterium]|nr:apolipoprotein N-acyltransferase [Polyangiaceae bacterium]